MELIQLLTMMDGKLDRLLAGSAPTTPTTEDRPGFTTIRPTGPHGVGKVRFWPEGHANLESPRDGEMILAYADRCSRLTDPDTGHPYWIGGRWPQLSNFDPYKTASGMAEMLDRLVYPYDWMDQEALDRDARLKAQDAAQGEDFSPHG